MSCQHRPKFFLGKKKNKHQPLHPFRGHIPLVPATNKNTSRSCRSSAQKLLKLRTEPFFSCSFIISARQSSRIDRPLSCQVVDLSCVFSKAAPNYINIYWHLVVLKPTVTRTHHFFTPKKVEACSEDSSCRRSDVARSSSAVKLPSRSLRSFLLFNGLAMSDIMAI